MYGGRVIDNFDRRIVKTYMDEYMGDFLFDDDNPFHFYEDDEVDYFVPEDGVRENYIGKQTSTKFAFSLFLNLLKTNLIFRGH